MYATIESKERVYTRQLHDQHKHHARKDSNDDLDDTMLMLNFDLFCMQGKTIFGHDSEDNFAVHGFEERGSFQKTIIYHASMEQIVALIEASKHCEQFIRFGCHHVDFTRAGK